MVSANYQNSVPASNRSTSATYADDVLKSSEAIITRLRGLRERLTGECSAAEKGVDTARPHPAGILSMQSTGLDNLHVATKLLDEVELLIG